MKQQKCWEATMCKLFMFLGCAASFGFVFGDATNATSIPTSNGVQSAPETSEPSASGGNGTTCNGQNEYFETCIKGCSDQLCSTIGQIFLCPYQPASKCKSGCRCKPGFFRNDSNICVPQDDCPPICKVNEQYSSCVNGGCVARNCSQVGKVLPYVDPVMCIKGCVCVKGYLRASNGTCVPQDQCTPICNGQNEYFETCIHGCSNQTCSTIGQIFHCPNEPAGECKSGCRCESGFFRNDSNVCVSQDDCPKPSCPGGEVWEWCPTVKCDGDNCPKTKNSPQTCPVGIVCDKPRCICGYNRKRDGKTGKCIPIPNCPPFKCDCNEEYKACPEQCSEENCSMYVNKTKCIPLKIGIIANCRPQCLCRKGYYRNSGGACVAPYECSTSVQQA